MLANITDYLAEFDRNRILTLAESCLSMAPATITSCPCPRSAGGIHDFFSEADYWWPDPRDPGLPYIRRDGFSNPANFSSHRHLLIQMSITVASLAAAWMISDDGRYARHAVKHLIDWFVDDRTMMNPRLEFAQAIQGRATGRGIGIVDTVHLAEVALAVEVLESSAILSSHQFDRIRSWFVQYVDWLTVHPFGKSEQNEKNNHGTCWAMQVAVFSRLISDRSKMNLCRHLYKTVLLPAQMALNGSFPRELVRTKPLNYSLFNLEMMAGICQVLSDKDDDLWEFELADGRGMSSAMGFIVPYIRNKECWPYRHDVMYFDEWPKRHNSLLFAGFAFRKPEYIELWETLEPTGSVPEVVRNLFLRQPILWRNSLRDH